TREKPVGLVFAAVSGPGRAERVRRLEIHGGRESVRRRAAAAALRLAFDAVAPRRRS
ncbi:MAG: CinA family protein, partial [Elusimicrobia bacterium]|nr:CinA family protein [Elusimicrobiota bacterium]